jgi:hypothetical protein
MIKQLRSIALAIALACLPALALAQTNPGTSPQSVAKGGTGAATAAGARTNLGLVIGSAVQAWDADLDALAALSGTSTIYYRSAANTWSAVTIGGMLSFVGGTLNVGDAELTALAGLTSAADKVPYFTGSGTAAVADFSSLARTLLANTTAAGMRSTLGAIIGTNVQAWDADLDCIAANSTAGMLAYTGAGTCSYRTLTAPAAGFTITNGAGTAGNPTFVLANDLAALEGLASTGFAVRTTTDTWAQRTLQAPAAGFTVTNPAGVAGDPTFVLANDLAALEGLSGTGIARRTGTDAWSVGTGVSVAEGGTGLASGTSGGVLCFTGTTTAASSALLTQYGILYGGGAGACPVAMAAATDGQLIVGQSSAAPLWKTISGDVTLSAAGAMTIGATKVTSAMLNADVFSTAHSWAGQQTFTNPIVGTQSPGDNSTKGASTAYADAIAALKANASRNISTGCGLAGGGDLSADRTLRLSLTVNAQTGTTYTVVDGDCGKVVRLNNASSVAVTLPQANGSTFVSGWTADFQNIGAGTVTITPTTSTINGGSNLVLTTNQGAHCYSDGTNYTCVLGVGAAAGSGTVTSITPGSGTASTITATAPGTAITSTGTIYAAQLVNAQTGTTYAIADGDRAKLVTASNAAAQAYSIAQAGASSAFQSGWFVDIHNISTNAAGIVTVTPTTSTINGASTLLIYPGQSARIVSDGTNYQTAFSPALANLTNSLSGDVTLNSTSTYFDGPSVPQATSGTWLATGNAVLQDTAGAATFRCKLWDGTTVAASSTSTGDVANRIMNIALSGIVTNPAGNIRISCADITSTNGKILFNALGLSKDSTVSAVRIQ